MVERGTGPKSLVRGANGCRELGHFLAVCLCVLIGSGFESESGWCVLIIDPIVCSMPLMGRPAFPFIGQEKAGVTLEGKKKNQKEKKSSEIVESFFSSKRVPPTL